MYKRLISAFRMSRLAAVLVATAAFMAAFATPAANAASHVGIYAQAEVHCDSITNQIHVGGVIGASAAYQTQRVAYELQIWSPSTGWRRLNSASNQRWTVLTHNRVTWNYELVANPYPHMDWVSTTHPWAAGRLDGYTFPDGNYYIYARYIWEAGLNSGVWVDANGNLFNEQRSPWKRTETYNWPNLGVFSHCGI